MASTLARRRKNELKDLAISLGLSAEGTKDDLQERIKEHVAHYGTSNPALQDLVREDSPEVASRRSSLSESNSRRSSRRLTGNLAGLSSQDEEGFKPANKSSRGFKSKTESDSDSTEDPLSEHQVRHFMEKMQDEVQEAKHLAHGLEETLQSKLHAGKEAIRRASKDLGETVTHALQNRRISQGSDLSGRRSSRDDAGSGHRHKHHHKKHHHRRHSHGGGAEEDEEGLLAQAWSEFKHRFANCAGQCQFATCYSRYWNYVHEAASNSTSLVWLSFLVEFVTFVSGSVQAHKHSVSETWMDCLLFFTHWDHFLRPFFVYYTSLFLLPTLLSQLFNVDRAARHHRKHENKDEGEHHPRPTGLLAKRTTSGLSFFVFKFALTYMLAQHVASSGGTALGNGWAQAAKEAVEALGGQGHHHLSMKQVCQSLGEVFRFVPATLSLATSGVGTVLALAETIVSRR